MCGEGGRGGGKTCIQPGSVQEKRVEDMGLSAEHLKKIWSSMGFSLGPGPWADLSAGCPQRGHTVGHC